MKRVVNKMPVFIIIIAWIIYLIWDKYQREVPSSKRNIDFVKRYNELYKDMPDMQIK